MQYQPKNNYKIYSRPRLNLGGLKNSSKSHRLKRKIKKTSPIFTVIIIAIITCFSIWNIINPIFENLCEDKVKSVATIITNEETTQITSDIAISIQKRLDSEQKNDIYIPCGAITGIKYLSGFGPRIKLNISSSGSIDTDLKSEFVSQGVNQTMHRVYLQIKTNVSVLTSFKTIRKAIENQVLIAEHIIVGEIPSTYLEKGRVIFSK